METKSKASENVVKFVKWWVAAGTAVFGIMFTIIAILVLAANLWLVPLLLVLIIVRSMIRTSKGNPEDNWDVIGRGALSLVAIWLIFAIAGVILVALFNLNFWLFITAILGYMAYRIHIRNRSSTPS